jgi:hypothetical protein
MKIGVFLYLSIGIIFLIEFLTILSLEQSHIESIKTTFRSQNLLIFNKIELLTNFVKKRCTCS